MQKMKIAAIILLSTLFLECSSKNGQYLTEDGFAQGSTYHIVYELPLSNRNPDSLQLDIKDSINLYFEQINQSVSGYDSTSLISKINRGENPPLNKIFIDIFQAACQFYQESNGAVDASAAPLFDMWGFGFKNKEEVTPEKIDSVMQFIGMDRLKIIQRYPFKEGSVTEPDTTKAPQYFLQKEDPRMKLNFNAIAQGYTSDYFGEKFDAMGIKNYMLEIGGEIYCKGVNASGKPWRVGIDKPADGNFIQGESIQAIVHLSNQGLVTSGNYRKFYIENGIKYSHTINPSTGAPVQHSLLCATVVAPNATIADAYATYFMVVGLEKAKEILSGIPDIEALLVYGEQDDMKEYYTPGLSKMVSQPKQNRK